MVWVSKIIKVGKVGRIRVGLVRFRMAIFITRNVYLSIGIVAFIRIEVIRKEVVSFLEDNIEAVPSTSKVRISI